MLRIKASPAVWLAPFISAAMLGLASCGAPVGDELPVYVDEATAATVNGEKIYISDVELEAVARGLVSPGQSMQTGAPEYETVLQQLVEQKLMAQEALRRGLDKTPASVRRLQMAQERILGNLLVEDLVAREVTEEQIEAMYQEQVKLQQSDDEVSIAHILVSTREEADALYARIQGGESFESLVLANSRDTATRMEKGDLGYVSPNDEPDPFPFVIANTAVGEVSEPFESDHGWHILKVKDRRSKAPKTREEMRPEIVTFLTLNQISKIVRRLKAEASVQQGEPGLDAGPAKSYTLPEPEPKPEEPAANPESKEL